MTQDELQKLTDECRIFLKEKMKAHAKDFSCLVVGFGWKDREENAPLGLVINSDDGERNGTIEPVEAIGLLEISANLHRLAERGLITEIMRLRQNLSDAGAALAGNAKVEHGFDITLPKKED